MCCLDGCSFFVAVFDVLYLVPFSICLLDDPLGLVFRALVLILAHPYPCLALRER